MELEGLSIRKSFSTFLIVLVFIVSCKKKHQENTSIDNSKKDSEFKEDRKISFLNKEGYFYSFLSKTYQDRYVYRKKVRSPKNGLDILNLKDQSLSEIILNEAQMRSLKRVRSFEVFNSDSIYVFGIVKYIIVNSKGETIDEDFFNHPIDDNYFPIVGSNNSKLFISDNNVYFTKIIDQNPSNDLYDSNTLMKFDLDNGKMIELKDTSYPKCYYDKCWLSLYLEVNSTYCKEQNSIIYSYPIDDNIYLYDLNKGKKLIIKSKKSKYKKRNVEDVDCKKVWDVPTYQKHSYENFLYGEIVYDKYRKVFYRFCYLETEEPDYKKQFNSLNKPFSIMVYDKQFNLIYESGVFNKKPKYIPFDFFINSEGLWISENNPDNETYEEDKLSFKLLKFVEYENK